MPLLEVDGLSVSFTQLTRGFRETRLIALQDVGLDVDRSEIVAVIGASGSGKSLLAHAVLGILPGNAAMSGSIRFDGKPLTTSRQEELRGRSISLIPQSVNFLDPLMRVGSQVRNSVKSGDPAAAQRSAFERFRLPAAAAKLYPHQLSGGMARRVLVATATVSGAELLIADEPTPGLDPAIMQEALATLRELADQGAAVLLISHDLDSALRVADRVAVLYAGTTVEVAPASDFAGGGQSLKHPYTKALWQALPQNGFVPLPGRQPMPHERQHGCLFAPRCPSATADCSQAEPEMRDLRGGKVRCIHAT